MDTAVNSGVILDTFRERRFTLPVNAGRIEGRIHGQSGQVPINTAPVLTGGVKKALSCP